MVLSSVSDGILWNHHEKSGNCLHTKILQYYDHVPHVICYIPVACFIPGGVFFSVIFIYVNFIYEVQTLQNGLHNLSEFNCNFVCQCFSPTISLQLYPIANRSDLPIFLNLVFSPIMPPSLLSLWQPPVCCLYLVCFRFPLSDLFRLT